MVKVKYGLVKFKDISPFGLFCFHDYGSPENEQILGKLNRGELSLDEIWKMAIVKLPKNNIFILKDKIRKGVNIAFLGINAMMKFPDQNGEHFSYFIADGQTIISLD